jgi:GR25 family glycosyltransferase involved in LPS biosynthesis
MKVFVIHYKKLVDRKAHILAQFQRHQITDFEFVEIDRDELSEENLSMFLPDYSKSQIAISLSHFYTYSQISEKYQYGLILEDDVILSDKFTTQFAKYMSQLPPDFDMLFIGNGCDFHIEPHKIISGKHIYAKGLYPTRLEDTVFPDAPIPM